MQDFGHHLLSASVSVSHLAVVEVCVKEIVRELNISVYQCCILVVSLEWFIV